ncbi:unnamed protein product [Peniophora sp. CBMAI 1063]|nr:unnamed protein product [Peniophora sp. CBMAI 1063]
MHYGPQWFPDDQEIRHEFDENPEGYDLLPAGGIFETVRPGDHVWYAGTIGPLQHHAPHQHRQFEYTPTDAGSDGPEAPDGEGGEAEPPAGTDEHRPDDPNALLPRMNQQVWLGEIRGIISVPIHGGLRRSYVWMRGYGTGLYLRSALPTRWDAIADLINNMHGREHVKLDTWEFCRVHDIVAIAEPVRLDDGTKELPPPLETTTAARAFISSGVVHFVDKIRNATAHRPLEYRLPPGHTPIACEHESCSDRAYNRANHEMAQCVVCRSWFHIDCLQLADAAVDWERARFGWDGGQAQGPPIRREPNLDAAEFLPAARGVWIRADVPTKTWGRATVAVERAKREVLNADGGVGGDTNGDAFKAHFRNVVRGGVPFEGLLSGAECEEALAAKAAPAPAATVYRSVLGEVSEAAVKTSLSQQFLGVVPPPLKKKKVSPLVEEDALSIVSSEAHDLTSECASEVEGEADSSSADDNTEEAKAKEAPEDQQKRKLETAYPILGWLGKDEIFLREMIRRKGQGDAFELEECPDCGLPGRPEYSCGECEAADLCRECIIKWHRYQPLHPIFRHIAGRPERMDPADLGLRIQLGHRPGVDCKWRESAHVNNFTVLHTTGLHRIRVDFCNCDLGKGTPRYVQLLRRGLWPSTVENPQSATTLQALDDFTRLSNLGRLTAYDYHRAASAKTDGAGLRELPDFLQQFMTAIHEYRHIMMFMRAGRGHEPKGIAGTGPGLCVVRCPACPDKNMNLEKGWSSRPQQWLYRGVYSLDANFRLSNRLSRSTNKTDPYLNHGCAYMPPAQDYLDHLDQMDKVDIEEPSDCSRFGAINQANMKAGRGLRTTGMAAVTCKHEFWQPNGITTLRKGERYVSVDYAFCGALKHSGAPTVLVTYDIACQWHKNLRKRLEKIPAQREIYAGAMAMLDFILKDKATFCVPKFHLYAHKLLCQISYAIGWMIGTGALDGEGPERCWSGTNGAASSLREMGPGTMHDTMDDICGSWNWVKVCGIGLSLADRMWRAVLEGRTQSAIFTEFTDALKSEEPEAVEKWLRKAELWEENRTKNKNPYQPKKKSTTIKQIQLESVLAQGHAMTALASHVGIEDAAGLSGAASSLEAALADSTAADAESNTKKGKGKDNGKGKSKGRKDKGAGREKSSTAPAVTTKSSEAAHGSTQPPHIDSELATSTSTPMSSPGASIPSQAAGKAVPGEGTAGEAISAQLARSSVKRKAPDTDGADYVLPEAVDWEEDGENGENAGHEHDGVGVEIEGDVDEVVAQVNFLLLALQIEGDQYRLDKKNDEFGDTLTQNTTRAKALNALVRNIERFREDQERLMPRVHATLSTEERNPERATAVSMKLWLPSDLDRTDDCVPSALRALEIRILWAAMSDALEDLMHQLRLRGCLNRFKILNISGQRANTRARTAQDAVDCNVKFYANMYVRRKTRG